MEASSSSSSSFPEVKLIPSKQVFINFRGKDVRHGFLSFLREAFRNKNVNIYEDEMELRSRDLQYLFKRIEESIIAVVIFSDEYTSSKWCLNELVKINERMIEGKLHVIPIFYKVTVENVKILEGNFGRNFRETKRNFRETKSICQNWEEALKSIPQKFGMSSFDYRYENLFVNAIVDEVIKVLNHITKEEAPVVEANRISRMEGIGAIVVETNRDRRMKVEALVAKANQDSRMEAIISHIHGPGIEAKASVVEANRDSRMEYKPPVISSKVQLFHKKLGEKYLLAKANRDIS